MTRQGGGFSFVFRASPILEREHGCRGGAGKVLFAEAAAHRSSKLRVFVFRISNFVISAPAYFRLPKLPRAGWDGLGRLNPTMEPNHVVVLGAGAWGTALAILLAREGRRVSLVPRREEHAFALGQARENADYLPGIQFPDTLRIAAEPGPELAGAEVAVLACPTQGMRGWAERLAVLPAGNLPGVAVSLAKGLETGTHLRPTEVLLQVLPTVVPATLSGPSNAAEVAGGRPTAVVLASTDGDHERQARLQALLSARSLRVYTSSDLAGVELGGCLKNIYAIAAGCCDGLRLGDNAKAALLTRALAEMVRLGAALGARAETFYGLGGFGDLVATANGAWSRNRTFGQQLAEGAAIESLVDHRRSVVEGYKSTKSFHELCQERGIDAPILAQVHAILYGGRPPAAALAALMSRELKRE